MLHSLALIEMPMIQCFMPSFPTMRLFAAATDRPCGRMPTVSCPFATAFVQKCRDDRRREGSLVSGAIWRMIARASTQTGP